MTRPAERDDLLLEHLLARDEPRAQAPRRDLAAMISMIVSLSGLAAAIFLGAVRSQLAEFYRPLGVSLEDVQLAAPYGGASFWSLGVFLGLLALFAAFASLGVVVRRSRPGRWAAVEVRRSRRAWWLACLTVGLPVTALISAPRLGVQPFVWGLLASVVLGLWAYLVRGVASTPSWRKHARRKEASWALIVAVFPWVVTLPVWVGSVTGSADGAELPVPGLAPAMFVLAFVALSYSMLSWYPGRFAQVVGIALEGSAGFLLLILVMVAFDLRGGSVVQLADAAALAYTVGFLMYDRRLRPDKASTAGRAALVCLAAGSILLVGVGYGVTTLEGAARAGQALRDVGELPSSPVLSENVHRAAVLPVGGDVMGICDATTRVLTLSSGSSPFVLLLRDELPPAVLVLSEEYVVVRVSSEQRGCLPVSAAGS